MLKVVFAHSTFASVVSEITYCSAFVECCDGVRTQSAKTHGRYIESRCAIGLLTFSATEHNPNMLLCNLFHVYRMIEAAIPLLENVVLCTKGKGILSAFSSAVDQVSTLA